MKKLLFIVIVLFCLSANAQDIIKADKNRSIISLDEVKKDMQQYQYKPTSIKYFRIDYQGNFHSMGSDRYILYYDNINKESLCKSYYYHLAKLYNSPRNSIEKKDSSIIVVNGYAESMAVVYGNPVSFTYKMIFSFKDNKVKISSPQVIEIWIRFMGRDIKVKEPKTWMSKIFAKEPTCINQIENFFNRHIDIINYDVKKSDYWW